MKYVGQNSDIEQSSEKVGVLIANLGTPDAPKCPKLRRYLTEFLTDPRVIELPGWLRQFLVRGIIINIRSHKSAAAYREVWTDQGSPLLFHSEELCQNIQQTLDSQNGNYQIELGMRYGKPSIAKALQKLHADGCRKVIVIPMYPQYSGSTTGSVFDAIADVYKRQRWVPDLTFINHYHDHPLYIDALCDSIQSHWEEHGRNDKLILSFHGIPQRYVKNGDPYQHHCEQTASAVAERLNLTPDDWLLVYQSRVGKEPWLQPYCDETMKSLPQQGVNSVDVICPGFSADCLETIEEIDGENKEYFLEAGGESYRYIPCLNSQADHVQMVCELIKSA